MCLGPIMASILFSLKLGVGKKTLFDVTAEYLIIFTNPSARAGYDTRSILSGV